MSGPVLRARALAGAAALTFGAAAAAALAPPPPLGRPTWNEPAPDLSVTTVEGARLRSQDLAGRVVLVNFWATWCPPCRTEMPTLDAVHRRYSGRGFTVLGLATDAGGPEAVRDFVSTVGVTYPVAFAAERVTRAWGGVRMLPKSFLLDRQGRVRKILHGAIDEETLRRAVEELLAEE